eukprot:COSAG03_NODE_20230_length_322_cov_1.381166_1_plen_35_part_10
MRGSEVFAGAAPTRGWWRSGQVVHTLCLSVCLCVC